MASSSNNTADVSRSYEHFFLSAALVLQYHFYDILRTSCPGQPSDQRYRRDDVDYTLISLRMAVKRVALPDLDTLSLQPVHPAAVFYLRPQLGYGASTASAKRWRNINNLNMEMDFQLRP